MNLLSGAAPVASPRLFYGWKIVIVAVLLNLFQGGILFYGFTLLVGPMREDLGWSLTNISLVFPVMGVFGVALAPALGLLFDRLGPRPLVIGGMALMGAGMVMWMNSHTLLGFYAGFMLANGGATAMSTATGAAVANWFVRRRGRAMGLYSMGYALAGLLALPFLWLIEEAGWRGALGAMALVTWALLVPAAVVIRRRPEDYGLRPDGDPTEATAATAAGTGEAHLTVREALRTRAFWLLSVGSSLGFLTISVIQVYETPYMESVGFTRRDAALLLTAIPLSTVLGRLAFGFLADAWDKRRATALALMVQGVAVLALAELDVTRVWLIPAFLGLWGLGWGGTVVTRPTLQGELFGRASFGTLQGLLWTTGEVGFALAPPVAGVVFDWFGTYRPVFLTFAVLALLAGPVVLAIPKPRATQPV